MEMTERRLRFCMVTTFYPPYSFGGDGIFVHRLSNELARRGHSVDVIHCKDAYRLMGGREPDRGYDDQANITVHGLESSLRFLSPLATHQTGYPLFKSAEIRRVLEKGFDVVHYHNISLLGPKVLEYGQGVKLYTLHEYWLVCPTHVLFKFNRAACTQPQCFLCSLSYKRPPQWWRYSGMMEKATRRVDAFLAPSQFSKNKHLQMGLAAPIVHLPPFVPDDDDGPSLQQIDRGASPYFLFVGRLETLKGAQTLVPIFRAYPKAQLWIAGTGSAEPEMRRLAAGSANIRFLGYRSGDELRRLYRHAVALIVPSLCFETFGQIIIEAFQQRTPVVGRNLGAVAEIIEESGGGVLYDADEELPFKLDLLLDDRRRQALGNNGHQAYLRNWTASAHLTQYLDLIRTIFLRDSPNARAT